MFTFTEHIALWDTVSLTAHSIKITIDNLRISFYLSLFIFIYIFIFNALFFAFLLLLLYGAQRSSFSKTLQTAGIV